MFLYFWQKLLPMDIDQLRFIASQVRRDIIRQTAMARSGHPGGALGATDILVALYFEIMRINPPHFSMEADGEDVFYLSNGHLSALWYSVLARRGYFPVSELSTFRQINSRLQGHPSPAEGLPGIRVASGSLGQGLSVAIGHALAKKLKQDNTFVYVMMGDGELQEGQIWEAAMFAGSKQVDNIIGIVDYNKKQIDGSIDEVVSLGNLRAKWEAFDWKVYECNGNQMQEVVQTLYEARSACLQKQPVVILMHTIMGYGVDFMENNHHWHGVPPSPEQAQQALAQLPETLGDF